MLARADALEALGGERFDVVVIGGGITGAGVALDAASRGYSVALVERDDYASGTSSRSSKMVHGGLRYLQNFDLGLVREALLERQLMVQLAPHLVYPTPFLVPTLGEERRNWRIGIGLNMYDVMATTRVGQGRRERQARERASRERASGERPDEDYWAPDRHRTIPGEEAAELIPALAARDPKEAYLFYDCQTDDVRLVLTVLGEAERFGAVFCNGAEVVELIADGGRAAGVVCVDAESGERFEVRADNVVNATGVWADRIRPEEILDEEEVPRIAPSRGTHVTVSFDKLPLLQAGVHRAGGRGPDDLRAALVRAGPDRHHRPRLRGRHRARPAVRRGHRVPARGGQLVLRPRARRGGPHRRLRGRAAADLDRRSPQVGGHLAQGGAVRDLLGAVDDHRRQADHLAADGEAGRRPDGRARGPRGALPHDRDPARDAGERGGPGAAPRPVRTTTCPTAGASCSPSATGMRRATC